MRAYMERPCDLYFTLEKKLSRFLTMSMRAYCVPPDEQQQVLAFIETLDIRGISERVMQELFRKLEMQFPSLSELHNLRFLLSSQSALIRKAGRRPPCLPAFLICGSVKPFVCSLHRIFAGGSRRMARRSLKLHFPGASLFLRSVPWKALL